MSAADDALRWFRRYRDACRDRDPLATTLAPIAEDLYSAVAGAPPCVDAHAIIMGCLLDVAARAGVEASHAREGAATRASATAEQLNRDD